MKALLLVDIQNDFLPGGAIPVENGNSIIPIINGLMDKFSLVLATKDYHPKNHVSFAETHKKKVGESISLKDGQKQQLWPSHCIEDSKGSEFSPLLELESLSKVFYKGVSQDCDSYSAFFDENRQISTGLDVYLKNHQVKNLYIGGLTAEYCVKYSALDALSLGYNVYLIEDAIGFINNDPEFIVKFFEDCRKSNIKNNFI